MVTSHTPPRGEQLVPPAPPAQREFLPEVPQSLVPMKLPSCSWKVAVVAPTGTTNCAGVCVCVEGGRCRMEQGQSERGGWAIQGWCPRRWRRRRRRRAGWDTPENSLAGRR